MTATRLVGLMAGALLLCASRVGAEPLDRLIPGLFGGEFFTSLTPSDRQDAQQPSVAARFRGLSAALAAARSQAPIPSASGAFSFSWDPDLDTFVRTSESLGSPVAERAQTLGRHTGSVSFSYTHIDFDTLEGDSLHHLQTSQAAFSQAFLMQLPIGDRMHAMNDTINTTLSMKFGFDLSYLSAAYGVTDTIDVSAAISINRASMSGSTFAVFDQHGDGGGVFTVNQLGLVDSPGDVCALGYRCAQDRFNGSAFGTGDIYLRGKWHFMDTEYADLATVGVLTLPTGNASDYLGFHDPTFTPWLVASKTFGRVSPHLNLGYAFRSGNDVSQAQWIAGADVRTLRWLTLAGDFLGYHDDKRDGINDDVLQSAVSFKLNPWGKLVLSGSFQFPLNSDGLRADVIYSGQVEYTF